jgi:hypothetical protein
MHIDAVEDPDEANEIGYNVSIKSGTHDITSTLIESASLTPALLLSLHFSPSLSILNRYNFSPLGLEGEGPGVKKNALS